MSSLDNLVTKIINDSQEKAAAIIKDAEREAAALVESRAAEAERVKDSLLETGRLQAQMQKELIVSAKRIEVRDEMLKTKQGLIEKVFATAVDKLSAMSAEEYLKFLEKYLAELELAGDEQVFVPQQYADISLAGINRKLGAKGKLTLGKEHVKSGFMVSKNGVENNNSYEALIDFYRDELEKMIAENLF